MPDIIHATTVHARGDTRIFLKEAISLQRSLPQSVIIYVQDGKGHSASSDTQVEIFDTGPRSKGRLGRMVLGAARMYSAVKKAKPKIVHFHDPELLPVAVLWRLSGIRFVYDAHEELPADLLSKEYIPDWAKKPASQVVGFIEQTLARAAAGVVAATPTIAKTFPSGRTVLVQNFPILEELFVPNRHPMAGRPKQFAYVGDITAIRGPFEMVRAMIHVDHPEAKLQLAGRATEALMEKLKVEPGWARVEYTSWMARREVAELLSQSRAGLVLFAPKPNHIKAQPNKMFEYMAAGLPVIASDFPLWREIIDSAKCGLLVDPQDPEAIAKAMEWMLENPKEAEEMGLRGRLSVEQTYNWKPEEKKLVELYRTLLS